MATLTSITTRPILTNDVEAKILRVFYTAGSLMLEANYWLMGQLAKSLRFTGSHWPISRHSGRQISFRSDRCRLHCTLGTGPKWRPALPVLSGPSPVRSATNDPRNNSKRRPAHGIFESVQLISGSGSRSNVFFWGERDGVYPVKILNFFYL